MSRYDYRASREISLAGHPFAALIMAAMRQADTDNLEKLKEAWPLMWAELEARYHAPGGTLPADDGDDQDIYNQVLEEDR